VATARRGTAEPSADGRWVVVDGRRWRASDPAIPPALRTELVHALMDARRAVAAARRDVDADADAEREARRRVGEAKVALGERGEPWWAPPTEDGLRARLAAAMAALADHRGPARSTCPSDAARAVGGERWRALLPEAREVARYLARQGRVELVQRGEVRDPAAELRGPIRVRAARRPGDAHGEARVGYSPPVRLDDDA
jgi:hypothetical protein